MNKFPLAAPEEVCRILKRLPESIVESYSYAKCSSQSTTIRKAQTYVAIDYAEQNNLLLYEAILTNPFLRSNMQQKLVNVFLLTATSEEDLIAQVRTLEVLYG
jgi:hypothetical protein